MNKELEIAQQNYDTAVKVNRKLAKQLFVAEAKIVALVRAIKTMQEPTEALLKIYSESNTEVLNWEKNVGEFLRLHQDFQSQTQSPDSLLDQFLILIHGELFYKHPDNGIAISKDT